MAYFSSKIKEYLKANSKTWDDEEGNIELQDDGAGPYVKIWNVSGLAEPTAEQISSYDTAADLADALHSMRVKRNQLITETDYLALSDHTLSSDMTTYRQELRDITNGLDTVEKVNNKTWPTKP